MNTWVKQMATVNDGCPNGGEHTGGTSGEWIGRCTKCGNPC